MADEARCGTADVARRGTTRHGRRGTATRGSEQRVSSASAAVDCILDRETMLGTSWRQRSRRRRRRRRGGEREYRTLLPPVVGHGASAMDPRPRRIATGYRCDGTGCHEGTPRATAPSHSPRGSASVAHAAFTGGKVPRGTSPRQLSCFCILGVASLHAKRFMLAAWA